MGNRVAPHLRRLIDAALAGRLTAPELEELEQWLREDDAALEAYLRACQLETDLHFHVRAALVGNRVLSQLGLGEPGLTPSTPVVPRDAAGGQRRRRLRGRRPRIGGRVWSAMAAMLLIGAFAWWASSYWSEIPAERQPRPVACLTEAVGAQWLGEQQLAIGHSFVEGDSVYLTKGRARISMASGAELALRAPCFVILSHADHVQLEEGVVTAQVADWGRGFTVNTEAMRVVDLGTKFAVSANASGVTEAHVLDGQVRIQPLSQTVTDRRSVLLFGGEAIRVESDRQVAIRLKADRQLYDAEMGSRPPFKPIQMFNTGMGLVPGDEDPHWRVTAGPKCKVYDGPEFAVVCEADRRYLAANDPSRSQWLSVCNPARPGVPPKTLFTFQTTFDLSGYDLSAIHVAAQVIADNGLQAVRLNGKSVPIEGWNLNEPQQFFNRFVVVDFGDGFLAGKNTIEFDVWNGIDQYEPEAANPMALRVEWQAFGRPLEKRPASPVTAVTAVDRAKDVR